MGKLFTSFADPSALSDEMRNPKDRKSSERYRILSLEENVRVIYETMLRIGWESSSWLRVCAQLDLLLGFVAVIRKGCNERDVRMCLSSKMARICGWIASVKKTLCANNGLQLAAALGPQMRSCCVSNLSAHVTMQALLTIQNA